MKIKVMIFSRKQYDGAPAVFRGAHFVPIPFTQKGIVFKVSVPKFIQNFPVSIGKDGITIRTSVTDAGDLAYFVQIFGKAPLNTPTCQHEYSPCGCFFRNYLGTQFKFFHRYQQGVNT